MSDDRHAYEPQSGDRARARRYQQPTPTLTPGDPRRVPVKLRDYLSDSRWYLSKAAVPVRNAAYRATRPLRTVTGRAGNWRRRRFLETGKGFAAERATRGLRSSLPVYRDRINPATGRPRRDDAEVYRRRDVQLARMREDRASVRGTLARSQDADRSRVREHADRVLGPGTADRAAEAHRQASVNPWAEREPRQGGRTR